MININKISYFDIFIKSILAGLVIGIAGIVNLSVNNSYLGAFLFSFGLITIIIMNLYLFTGKIGTIKLKQEWKLIPIMIIGNYLGTLFASFLIKYTRLYNNIYEKALNIYNIKIEDTYLSIFILAFFCGVMMFLAVVEFSINKSLIIIIFSIMIFILSNYEHSIANMFYFNIIMKWNFESITKIIIMILGNAIGSLFFKFIYYKK